jgi:hypothetical protein
MQPEARRKDLIVQQVGDDLLVYDQRRHRALCLNRTVALIWRRCDGTMTVADLAALLQRELDLPADEDLVRLALDRLKRSHLLHSPLEGTPGTPRTLRRELIRKLGLAGTRLLLLPVVASISAPTPAQAQSNASCIGATCNEATPCGSPCSCIEGKCVRLS